MMTHANNDSAERSEPAPIARVGSVAGSALPEWMNTPEKRRHIWSLRAMAAAFVGDKEMTKECIEYAAREDAKCAVPRMPNVKAQPRPSA